MNAPVTPPAVHVSGKHGVIGVPNRPEIINIFPSAKIVTLQGNEVALLSHGVDETRFLRNIGIEVPSPILHRYDWCGGTPFDVQKATAAMLTVNPRAYVLNGMGTGKTKSALWSWDFLNKMGDAKKMLVTAPLSTLNFTWAKEVFETMPMRRVSVLHGDRTRRLKRLEEDADIYVVNHDGLKVIFEALMERDDIDTLVLDELAAYRNGQADRTKVTRKVAGKMKWVWGMTGSPTPNEPTDAWGQCSIVNPTTIPKTFGRFRDMTMTKITPFKWAPKQDALSTVHKVMQPAVRYTLDDIVELPELIERTIDVDLGKAQVKIYKAMEAQAHAEIASGSITAMNAGAVLNKLLQISCGWVYDSTGEAHPLDNELRIQAMIDIVNATDRKALVFVPFKHALAGISEALTKEGIEHAAVSGDTSQRDRSEVFNLFQNTNKYKVIAAHPQCMSHGLTLTAADTLVWFAPTMSLEIFEQANARIRRYGQKHKQQVLMLQSTKVEKKAYTRLRAKQSVQTRLLEMFED